MDDSSYAHALKDIKESFQELTRDEMQLFRAEIGQTVKDVKGDVIKLVTFGSILVLSTFPFITFLVIGLGYLLNGNYWLSALVVSAIMAVTGAFFTYRAFLKIRSEEMNLPISRENLRREKELIIREFGKAAH